MSTDLQTQLARYGDLFVAELDTVTVEDAMTSRNDDGNVATLEPVERKKDISRHVKGMWLAAAVFALVVAAGAIIGIGVLSRNDVPPTGTTEPSIEEETSAFAPPFESARDAVGAYMAAFDTGTAEDVRALLADDFSGFGVDGPEIAEIDEQMRFIRALGLGLDVVSCTENSPTSITCQALATGSERDLLILGITEADAQITLRLDDAGLISTYTVNLSTDGDPPFDLTSEFNRWVNEGNTVSWLELDPRADTAGQLDISPEEAAARYLAEHRRFIEERG